MSESKAMTGQIEFKSEFIDLLRDLSIVVPGIILYKENGQLFIFRKSATDIYYRLVAPLEYFNFDGDYFAIKDFGEFYSFLKTMNGYNLFDKESHILVKDTNSQFKYPLTDEDAFHQELSKLKKKNSDDWVTIHFTETPAFQCNFDQKMVKEIKAVAGRINNEFITLTIKNNELTINCFIGDEYPSWQKTYKSDIDTDADVSFKIYTDVFNFLPNGVFQFKIDEDGCIKLNLDHKEIELDIVAAAAGE
jgi:hypothetical protein